MHGCGVFPDNKSCSRMQKKEIFLKLIYSTKTNLSISFFSKFLVKFLRNSIKQVVSGAVLRALSGVLKAALLKAMAFQSAF